MNKLVQRAVVISSLIAVLLYVSVVAVVATESPTGESPLNISQWRTVPSAPGKLTTEFRHYGWADLRVGKKTSGLVSVELETYYWDGTKGPAETFWLKRGMTAVRFNPDIEMDLSFLFLVTDKQVWAWGNGISWPSTSGRVLR